jgi:hypothetical protein
MLLATVAWRLMKKLRRSAREEASFSPATLRNIQPQHVGALARGTPGKLSGCVAGQSPIDHTSIADLRPQTQHVRKKERSFSIICKNLTSHGGTMLLFARLFVRSAGRTGVRCCCGHRIIGPAMHGTDGILRALLLRQRRCGKLTLRNVARCSMSGP